MDLRREIIDPTKSEKIEPIFKKVQNLACNITKMERVFAPIEVGSFVKIHLLEVDYSGRQPRLTILNDYCKGLLDVYTPQMLKLLVKVPDEEVTNFRVPIECVIDVSVAIKEFVIEDVGVEMLDQQNLVNMVEDIIEHMSDLSMEYVYIIEVI